MRRRAQSGKPRGQNWSPILFACPLWALGRCGACGISDQAETLPRQRDGFGAAAMRAAHGRCVCLSSNAEADTAYRFRFTSLRLQRKARDVDRVVQQTNGHRRDLSQGIGVQSRIGCEWLCDASRKIEGDKKTGTVWWLGLLAARIGRVDRFSIPQIVRRGDSVDKNDAGFCGLVGRTHDAIP